ncbi:TraB/GumN family protein [Thermodesulfobacteriota bacterium]
MLESSDTHRLTFDDKEIVLIGTAHVSMESAELVEQIIQEEKPETVCLELCQSRYQSIRQKNNWQNTDLLKVIKEQKAFLLLSNLMLAYFQKKIGHKLGIRPGEEIMRAIQAAEEADAEIYLADRDIRTTLSRTWRLMGLWTKMKLSVQLLTSAGELDNLDEKDIEKMKREDVLEALLSEMEESFPAIRRILIDERDQYLAAKIREAPGTKIVAIVGAGHVPGIKKYWQQEIDMNMLEQIPPRSKLIRILKWAFPVVILGLIILGFFIAGTTAGAHMIKWWVLANAVLAGLGAALALGHPLTILSAVVASPLTSLNPMIAAGWVSGLVEAFLGKPKVKDFERLPEDISSLKGFWKNKITRILLVVVFTNIGSSVGTFVALPLMMKAFA